MDRAHAWRERLTTPVRSQSRDRAARSALVMTFPRRGAATQRTSSASRRTVEAAPKIDAASRSSLQDMLSSLQADVTRLRARAGPAATPAAARGAGMRPRTTPRAGDESASVDEITYRIRDLEALLRTDGGTPQTLHSSVLSSLQALTSLEKERQA